MRLPDRHPGGLTALAASSAVVGVATDPRFGLAAAVLGAATAAAGAPRLGAATATLVVAATLGGLRPHPEPPQRNHAPLAPQHPTSHPGSHRAQRQR